MFRGYLLLCVQESLLVMLVGPYGMPGQLFARQAPYHHSTYLSSPMECNGFLYIDFVTYYFAITMYCF